MSQALYRKYRSTSLSEVVGQKHVTDILSRALASGKIAHAYLLTGPRGVGKTSIARILAHEINNLPYENESNNLDIIEIDAASNNGVEDIRDLREKIHITPVSASKKIYIIDEVHMLSKAAFNALLKTLEEPPEHAVFILATTDADKLPETIISRTQRFNFRSISPKDATAHLKVIAQKENISIEDDALGLIAQRGEGSFRDSIGLLDQLQSIADGSTRITKTLVEEMLGLAPAQLVENLLQAYLDKNLSEIIRLLDEAIENGLQPTVLTTQLTSAIRARLVKNPKFLELLDDLLQVSTSAAPDLKLLTALARHATVPTKSAALAMPRPVISAPLKELRRQATFDKPYIPKPQKPTVPIEPTILDWSKVVEYTKQHYVATYSVLTKCRHDLQDTTLTIYTKNKFYKTKLDEVRYRTNLIEALKKTSNQEFNIITIGTAPPPKDSIAASVAAIMGGGEEVSLDE